MTQANFGRERRLVDNNEQRTLINDRTGEHFFPITYRYIRGGEEAEGL